MGQSSNAENEKQGRRKPPLRAGQIAGEILAGMATGLAVTLLVVCVLVARSGGDCFGVGKLLAAAAGFLIVPPLYAFAAAVGVYLVGRRGCQTGSFLATLGCGLLGIPVAVLLCVDADAAGDIMLGIAKIVIWLLAFLAMPVMATLGFNLTRRYKEPPSS